MKRFYENELHATLSKLQHINGMLTKLGAAPHVDVPVGSPISVEALKHRATQISGGAAKKRKKKRGRKSIWGEFILRTLRQLDRPISYREVIEAAKFNFNIKDENIKTLKAAINQSAFRLRTIHKKIETFGEEGKKEKYLALSAWYDEDGNLKKEYLNKIS